MTKHGADNTREIFLKNKILTNIKEIDNENTPVDGQISSDNRAYIHSFCLFICSKERHFTR